MVRNGKPYGTAGQQSLGELVALAAKDVSSLIRYEITLAKSEFKMDLRRIAFAAAFAVVAMFVVCLLVILLCFALAYGLADMYNIPIWAGFLCTVGACILLIVIASVIALLLIRRFTGMKMTRQTVTDDISMLRKSVPSPNGSRPAVTNPEIGTGTTAGIPPARP